MANYTTTILAALQTTLLPNISNITNYTNSNYSNFPPESTYNNNPPQSDSTTLATPYIALIISVIGLFSTILVTYNIKKIKICCINFECMKKKDSSIDNEIEFEMQSQHVQINHIHRNPTQRNPINRHPTQRRNETHNDRFDISNDDFDDNFDKIIVIDRKVVDVCSEVVVSEVVVSEVVVSQVVVSDIDNGNNYLYVETSF